MACCGTNWQTFVKISLTRTVWVLCISSRALIATKMIVICNSSLWNRQLFGSSGSLLLGNLSNNWLIFQLVWLELARLSSARNFDIFCQLGSAQLVKLGFGHSSAQLSSPNWEKFWLSSPFSKTQLVPPLIVNYVVLNN